MKYSKSRVKKMTRALKDPKKQAQRKASLQETLTTPLMGYEENEDNYAWYRGLFYHIKRDKWAGEKHTRTQKLAPPELLRMDSRGVKRKANKTMARIEKRIRRKGIMSEGKLKEIIDA